MKLLCIADVHADFARFAPDSLPDADVCLLAGDITNFGERRPGEVQQARYWIDGLRRRFPVFWVPGNHDFGLDWAEFRFAEGGEFHPVRCLLPEAFLRRRLMGSVEETGKGIFCPSAQRAVDARRMEWKGVSFVGQALCTAFDLPQLVHEWAYTTATEAADAQVWEDTPPAQIVVSHCPPLGILDSAGRVFNPETGGFGATRHIGSPGLRHYIERHNAESSARHKPRLVVVGHAHGNVGEEIYMGTRIVNTAQTATLVTLEDA